MTEFYSHLEVIGRHYNYQPHRWHNGMVSVLASSAVDRGFEPRSGQTIDYKIGICCFSAKQAALERKNTNWLARNQDNVSIHGLLFQ